MDSRDVYYRDPELFMKQAVVDRYVDDIAYTLGIDRDSLNVVGFLGNLSFCFSLCLGRCSQGLDSRGNFFDEKEWFDRRLWIGARGTAHPLLREAL